MKLSGALQLGLAADWPYRILAVATLIAIALAHQVAAVYKQTAAQAEQRFQFKVADESGERRFKAFKKMRRTSELLTNAVLVAIVVLVVVKAVAK